MDIEDVQPRMRRLVSLLRAHGFRTTDSGDGETNPAAGMECALDVPHVVAVVEPASMASEADRCRRVLEDAGAVIGHGDDFADVVVQYSATDGHAILIVSGLTDARLP
jgi:hypothetical protein